MPFLLTQSMIALSSNRRMCCLWTASNTFWCMSPRRFSASSVRYRCASGSLGPCDGSGRRRSAMLSPCFLTHCSNEGSSALQCGQWYMKNSITSTFLPVAWTGCGWASVTYSTPLFGSVGDANAEVDTTVAARLAASRAKRRERIGILLVLVVQTTGRLPLFRLPALATAYFLQCLPLVTAPGSEIVAGRQFQLASVARVDPRLATEGVAEVAAVS